MQSTQQKSSAERSIGAILIDSGKLSASDAEKIIREQKNGNLRFGDAAIKLGLLTDADIQSVLAHQFDYPYLAYGDASIAEEVTAAYSPFSVLVEELRGLRTQLMLRWFDTDVKRKSIAITSPGKGEGRSFIAANLAVIFSQLGERTLLIDADLRHPRQHQMFKIANSSGLSTVLAGRVAPADAVVKIDKLVGLSVLPAGATPPNPQELLSRDAFQAMLNEYSESYDVIIIDTPHATGSADAQTVASRAGAALLVARKNFTHVVAMQKLINNLQHSNINIVGSLLNDF